MSKYFKTIKKNNFFKFCSKEDIKMIENPNSWSYSINNEIKGIPLHDKGNYAMFFTCNICETK